MDQDYLKGLTQEIKAFIDQTEELEVKRKLEWESKDCFIDLFRIFVATHRENQCYPFVMDLMEEAICFRSS